MSDSLGSFECELLNCLTDADGSLVVSFRAPSANAYAVRKTVETIRTGQKDGKERLTARLAWFKQKRSLDANAYFHVLVGKIAKATHQSETEVKRQLVFDYGTPLGAIVMEADKQPEKAGIEYAKPINEFMSPKGKPCIQYMLYKQTRTLDTAEMARLIEGTIEEAKQLGIETQTPEELEKIRYMEEL